MLYELPDFEYLEPKSIDEALQILSSYGAKAKILAGGTDLLGLMKDRIHGREMPIPSTLVNIKKIAELKTVDHGAQSSTIGSAVTLREITSNEELGRRFPSLVQAARSVATTQIRNMGTLGGNLCQRPWCWYFRHPAFDCFKKGGRQCYAVTGDNSTYFSIYNIGTCVMSHPSDTAPALMSLRATAKIGGPSGFRDVSLEDFFLGPKNVKDNILSPEEILVSVTIPKMEDRERSVYLKYRVRNNWDFALASVAVRGSVKADDSTISEGLRIVLGGVAPLPIRFRTLETNLVGKKYDSDSKSMVSEIVRKEAKPLRMNHYKVRILRALVLRGLDQVLG
jgi:xanthine dehydrogenase YagS FAD-binding subunit